MNSIRWHRVGYAYPDGPAALSDISMDVASGEVLLVIGPSGSGKSTLLRSVNGLVPHASGGRFTGDVVAFGRSTRDHRPRDMADLVGFVHQDPEAQFVVDQVEHDIAFVLENLALDPVAMRRRVEEVLDALGIAHLRDRSPATLSGGERQRAALAGAFAATPAALVLDEPTSQLDPQGADDVFAALARLNNDFGTTVLLAEHRLERAAPMADRALLVERGRIVVDGPARDVVVNYPGAPPVAELGRLMGWDPIPLTVREGRRAAAQLELLHQPDRVAPVPGASLLRAHGLSVAAGGRTIVSGIELDLAAGEVVALFGRNGSGKTTLLRTLAGLTAPAGGSVVGSAAVGFVPQDPNSLLYSSTVRREVAQTLKLMRRPNAGEVDEWLNRLSLSALDARHPRSLSAGERQRVAIAAVAVASPDVLLLDEPTRGIDAASRHALEAAMLEHAAGGGAVILATHDVELAARSATRVVVLGDGDVVADGPARSVLSGSLFSPQVLRVLPPFLTVAEVATALDRVSPT